MQDAVSTSQLAQQSTGPYTDLDEKPNRVAAVVGGAALAVSGAVLAAYAFKERSWRAAGMALAAPLVYRTATGRWPVPHQLSERAAEATSSVPAPIETSLTIARSPEELYAFWRQLENLPRFMKNLESVSDLGDGRSHWVGKGMLGFKAEWDAEIVEEREGQLLSWRSLPGAQIHNAGSVLFEKATGGRGTVVRVTFELQAAHLSRMAGKVLNPVTKQQIREDLRRFKSLMESGETPTTEGQPAGRRPVINIRNPI